MIGQLAKLKANQKSCSKVNSGRCYRCHVQNIAQCNRSTPILIAKNIYCNTKIWLNKTEKYILLGNNGNALYIDGKFNSLILYAMVENVFKNSSLKLLKWSDQDFCIVLYPDCVLSILTKLTKIVVISSDLISRCKFIYHVRFFSYI